MKTIRTLLALLLCLLTLAACAQKAPSNAAAPAESAPVESAPAESAPAQPQPQSSAAPDAQTPDAAEDAMAMDLTQETVVRKATYEDKEEFARFLSLASPAFVIPGLQQAMIPQGMCARQSTGTVYLSGYFSAARSSAVVAIDRASGTFKAQYELCAPDGGMFLSHVGGLAVTESDLYVSAKLDSDGQYQIARIPLSALHDEGAQRVNIEELITVPVSPSFLSYSQNTLWLGNFYHPSGNYDLPSGMEPFAFGGESFGCFILGYDMSAGREAVDFMKPDHVLCAPDRIQGMLLRPDGTVLLSQSYGRKNDSALLLYSLSPDEPADARLEVGELAADCHVLGEARLRETITAMPMTEALALDTDGGTLLLFESGAMKYNDGKHRTDHVWSVSLP